MVLFEDHRGKITERDVALRQVVEGLDRDEGGKLIVTTARRDCFIQAVVALEGAPGRLHHGVVVAIFRPARGARC